MPSALTVSKGSMTKTGTFSVRVLFDPGMFISDLPFVVRSVVSVRPFGSSPVDISLERSTVVCMVDVDRTAGGLILIQGCLQKVLLLSSLSKPRNAPDGDFFPPFDALLCSLICVVAVLGVNIFL